MIGPSVTIYPIHDHLADKICAIYEWHNNLPSTRYRDLADLLLIAQKETINGHAAEVALSSEIRRRLALGTDLRLPYQFEVPDIAAWRAGYPEQAGLVPGLERCSTLDAATTLATAFLDPILQTDLVWNPGIGQWESPGQQK